MQLDARTFDPAAFVAAYPDNYIIFMTGGWDYTTKHAYYKGLLCYGSHRKKIEKQMSNIGSPNVAMLIGTVEACNMLKKQGTILYLVTPTPLGFKIGKKGKGPNVELVQEVLRICGEKMIVLNDIDLHLGGELIRDVIDGKIKI